MTNGPVVSNTTPLINLAGIGLLDVLAQLYGNITVPSVVVAEYQAKAGPNDPDLNNLTWLTIVDSVPIDSSLPPLGAGETAAISLARQLSARMILVDERKARRIAASCGIAPVGTLAVMVRAKRQGIIPAVRPYIDLMVGQGRYFSEALIEQIVHAAGE